MKMTEFHEKRYDSKGKNKHYHVVKKPNITGIPYSSEVRMNINMIATVVTLGLGIIAFLTLRMNPRQARQPIVLETRRLYSRQKYQ